MKVLLTAVNSKYIHSNLAVRYLKAFTKDLQYDCKIREFTINDRLERVLEQIIQEKPDIVAFSCYIWNMRFIEELARLIKLVDDNIEILYGGPEVSYNGEEFLQQHVGEYLIEGEGEQAFREFIQYKISLENSNETNAIQPIKGLYSKHLGVITYGGQQELMNIDDIVFPYNEKEDINEKIVYYEASRGCPFNCKYCLSSTFQGVRLINADRVKSELKYFIDRGVRLVKFVDRTFNCNPKFAMDIWSFLMDQETDTTFHFEISADILTQEEIDLLSKAPKGRFQFEIGVQTTDIQVLKNINRHKGFQTIKEKVLQIEAFGNINQHLDLIVGLPGEDFETFKRSFNDVYSVQPDKVQVGFLKLLRGSAMREEAEKWGMVYSPYPPYEILKTNHISYEEINTLKRVDEMIDKYYNSNKFDSILKYFIEKFPSPFDFYFKLGEFFYEKGYFSRNISSAEYYKVFLEFNKEVINGDNFAISEIVKYDYLSFNKKKWVPDFLTREIDKSIERLVIEKIKAGELSASKNIHIEKFFIDILAFVERGIVQKEGHYILFDDVSGNIIDLHK
ncbi:MAG: DUF4080 domain-containing protein [Bacillota bacterium]|nr:DUF4080 domain-containing protein [Bacillota bacterium]